MRYWYTVCAHCIYLCSSDRLTLRCGRRLFASQIYVHLILNSISCEWAIHKLLLWERVLWPNDGGFIRHMKMLQMYPLAVWRSWAYATWRMRIVLWLDNDFGRFFFAPHHNTARISSKMCVLLVYMCEWKRHKTALGIVVINNILNSVKKQKTRTHGSSKSSKSFELSQMKKNVCNWTWLGSFIVR